MSFPNSLMSVQRSRKPWFPMLSHGLYMLLCSTALVHPHAAPVCSETGHHSPPSAPWPAKANPNNTPNKPQHKHPSLQTIFISNPILTDTLQTKINVVKRSLPSLLSLDPTEPLIFNRVQRASRSANNDHPSVDIKRHQLGLHPSRNGPHESFTLIAVEPLRESATPI
jgi:hypothetical protein